MHADAASLTSVRHGAESNLTDKAVMPLVSIKYARGQPPLAEGNFTGLSEGVL